MKGLGTRLLTAVIAIPILVGVVGWTPWYGFGGLAVVALGIALFELFNMTLNQETKAMKWGMTLWGLGTMAVIVLLWNPPKQWGFPHAPIAMPVFLVSMLGLFATFLAVRGRSEDLSPIPANFNAAFFGVFYIALCGAHIILMTRLPDVSQAGKLVLTHSGWVFLALFTNFGSDTGGYFFGKLIGGPKLYPNVSPNKTWAGLFGCNVGAMLGAYVMKLTALPLLTVLDCVVIGLIVGNVGQMGDFFESMLKRSYKVKDTGAILPGHGGLLDRIDALLATGPILFYYATWFVLVR